MGSKAAVQHGSLAGGPPGPAQIDRSGGAVGDEIAVPEHEAQPVGTARRGGDVAVGKVVVYCAQDALLKQGIGPAKDEVDVPRDLAALVILRRGAAGRKLAGAQKTVLLPFSLGQGRAEERVLVAQQPYPAEHGLFGIHIGGNGLPHGTARTGIVGNGQILHRYAAAAEKSGVAAEGVGGPPIRVGQLAAVPKDQGGGIGSRAPQGKRPFFTDQLFPVDAGADADLCFQLVGHRQHGLRDAGKIAAAILGNGEF